MDEDNIKKRILRLATALHNACQKTYKERKCNECAFSVGHGCDLYEHPISWQYKLELAKKK